MARASSRVLVVTILSLSRRESDGIRGGTALLVVPMIPSLRDGMNWNQKRYRMPTVECTLCVFGIFRPPNVEVLKSERRKGEDVTMSSISPSNAKRSRIHHATPPPAPPPHRPRVPSHSDSVAPPPVRAFML